jgi:hypothetical protein
MKMTADLPEEDRDCSNCIYRDGCKGARPGNVCSEHEFEKKEGELTETEKKSILADKEYQRMKEDDL